MERLDIVGRRPADDANNRHLDKRSMQLRVWHDHCIDPRCENRLSELARQVENGETIVVTRHGRPIFDLVPHRPRSGLRLEAIDAFKKEHGVTSIVPFIADDFDDPLTP